MIRTPLYLPILTGVCLGLAMLAGCARSARPAAHPESDDAAAVADADDPLICEKEQVTGSRMMKRVCRRQSEIRREREGTQSTIHRARPEPSLAPEQGMGGM